MSAHSVRVLVADGEEGVRNEMFRALLDREVFCDCVGSAGDAIVRLAERRYSLVLLDLSLPHAGAAAVVESLRAIPAAERPIVIATATGEAARQSDSELVQLIFRRPVRVPDVAEMVGACLAQVRTT